MIFAARRANKPAVLTAAAQIQEAQRPVKAAHGSCTTIANGLPRMREEFVFKHEDVTVCVVSALRQRIEIPPLGDAVDKPPEDQDRPQFLSGLRTCSLPPIMSLPETTSGSSISQPPCRSARHKEL
jgi:hypothetical protein